MRRSLFRFSSHHAKAAAPALPLPALVEQGFHVQVPWPVAWGDMDCFGHVNNTVYFKYFESARIAYFERCKIDADPKMMTVGPILASIGCRFKRPMAFPDEALLCCRVKTVHHDRFVLEHAVYSHKLGGIAAVGDGLIVPYCYKTLKKADLPAEWATAIYAIDGVSKDAK